MIFLGNAQPRLYMKLALVFDDLIQHGGAEKLLLATHEIWPDAPVYTTVATKHWEELCVKKGINLKTSFLQKFPFKIKLHRFYAALFFHILALRQFDFSSYDVVLSISSRFAHLINVKFPTKHVCYMNSPGRMYWEPHFYFKKEKFGEKLLKILNVPLSLTRLFDYKNAQKVDYFIANSKTPKYRIKKYYGKNAKIIYPFVQINAKNSNSNYAGNDTSGDSKSSFEKILSYDSSNVSSYFLIMTRLAPWKRVDIAIKACQKHNLPLKIIGTGSALKSLKKLAKNSDNIEFLGYVSDSKRDELLSRCLAFIVTQKEDFGISPLEAMSFGKPVIAYKKGGVLETVTQNLTGMFFDDQHEDSLAITLRNFDAKTFNAKKSIEQANNFTKEKFQRELKDYLSSVYLRGKV